MKQHTYSSADAAMRAIVALEAERSELWDIPGGYRTPQQQLRLRQIETALAQAWADRRFHQATANGIGEVRFAIRREAA